ncbi:MAG: hypothetical protein MK538_12115 [Planctomycetes bacterium]|nr:hypothetical protein [Planctomycetota bacterium]
MRDNLLATRVRGLGGTETAAKSSIYGKPLLIKGATELKAKSFKHNMIESDTSAGRFVVREDRAENSGKRVASNSSPCSLVRI